MMKENFFRRLAFACSLIAGVAMCSVSNAQLIDDFSGPLSGYTQTTILDVNGGASNTSVFQLAGGGLEVSTTNYDDIEQIAFIRNGLGLNVGQEVRADFSSTGNGSISGNRNFGLYVGGTAPATGVRQDYISVYGQNQNGRVFQRGFDGTSPEYPNLFADPTGVVDYYFVARTAVNTFEAGFFDGTRTIVSTLTPTTPNTADFVGFYADIRGDGTLGAADNLRIAAIPEPSSLALMASAGLLGFVRRRRS